MTHLCDNLNTSGIFVLVAVNTNQDYLQSSCGKSEATFTICNEVSCMPAHRIVSVAWVHRGRGTSCQDNLPSLSC